MARRRHGSKRRFFVFSRSKVLLFIFVIVVAGLMLWQAWHILKPRAMPTGSFTLQGDPMPVPPALSAQAAILIDGYSGRVLYERRASDKLAVASLTKMMSVILALQIGDSEETVTVSPSVLQVEPVLIGLQPGEIISLGELEAAALVHSGNDAALMLAEHLAGSEELYAVWMTNLARAIGCLDTSYKNAHGLDQYGHISTAEDQARVARYALKDARFANLAKTSQYTIRGNRTAWNLNRLLDEMPAADGIKIGFTDAAGRCLAASATQNGVQLIAVVLNAPDWFDDAQKLLEYGFGLPLGAKLRGGAELQKISYGGMEYSLCVAENMRLPLFSEEWYNLHLDAPYSELENLKQQRTVVKGYLDAYGLKDFEILVHVR